MIFVLISSFIFQINKQFKIKKINKLKKNLIIEDKLSQNNRILWR